LKSSKTKTVTKSKPKQISVNLEQIWNPNPGLVKAYADAKATELFVFDRDNRSEYLNEARIFNAARASKKPIKHVLFGLYRKLLPSGKEVLYFFDNCSSKDYWQNDIGPWTRLIGKWDKPQISQPWGLDPASLKSDSAPEPGPLGDPSIMGFETQYDLEWNSMHDQILKWRGDGTIPETAIYYVVIGQRRYSVPYAFEQWFNLDIESLELLGEHGRRFKGLLGPNDPKTLELIKETIKSEIAQGLTKQQQK
jgi:hypothetical protein